MKPLRTVMGAIRVNKGRNEDIRKILGTKWMNESLEEKKLISFGHYLLDSEKS